MDELARLREIEQQVEREWWLSGALNAVAEMQVVRRFAHRSMFKNRQATARDIDRRRLELSLQLAESQGWGGDGRG